MGGMAIAVDRHADRENMSTRTAVGMPPTVPHPQARRLCHTTGETPVPHITGETPVPHNARNVRVMSTEAAPTGSDGSADADGLFTHWRANVNGLVFERDIPAMATLLD